MIDELQDGPISGKKHKEKKGLKIQERVVEMCGT